MDGRFGHQYVVGSFDGTKFTPDAEEIFSGDATPLPADSVVFEDFEGDGGAGRRVTRRGSTGDK